MTLLNTRDEIETAIDLVVEDAGRPETPDKLFQLLERHFPEYREFFLAYRDEVQQQNAAAAITKARLDREFFENEWCGFVRRTWWKCQ